MNQMVKRIIMSVLGVVICGISVGMFKFAALGIDPFQSLMSGLDAVIPIRFGTLYIIVNVVLLLFALIFDRKKSGSPPLSTCFCSAISWNSRRACANGSCPTHLSGCAW